MTLKPLGDAAWLVEFPTLHGGEALAQVTGLRDALHENPLPGVVDVVPSFNSLAVHFHGVDGREIRDWLSRVEISPQPLIGREVEIPVCYGGDDGPDLAELAATVGLTPNEVVALHSGATYTVAAVGFAPGFPYLLGLPEQLRLPRRATPRARVAAGSVAVAGGQAGIYPSESPGGWHILGRTARSLFDPQAEPPAWLQTGDRVRFVAVDRCESPEMTAPHGFANVGPVEVIHPGALTSVQDLGRPGFRRFGVSPGGAVDRDALRLANLLVGNDESAPVLEMTLTGPVLKFHQATTVALVGATGRPRHIAAGETVDFSKIGPGARACLAIAGGFEVPLILGSASTDVRGGFGGRVLQAGDRLKTGMASATPQSGDWYGGTADPSSVVLRFVRGVQAGWFSADAHRLFHSEAFQLTPHANRMGARLSGPPLEQIAPQEMVSQPVVPGSVQVPPDGQPIVLLAGCQTIGGYPQIGHVISADLPMFARLPIGAAVHFSEVTHAEAQAALRRADRAFQKLRLGVRLLESAACDGSI